MPHSSGIAVDGISATKLCGENVCGIHEYCSAFHTFCEPCSNLCLTSSNNFNADKCITDCQDFLHDITYVRKDDRIYNELLQKYNNLTIIVYILLLLFCLLTLLMLPFLIGLFKNLTRTCRVQKLFTRSHSTPISPMITNNSSSTTNNTVSNVSSTVPIDVNRTLKMRQLKYHSGSAADVDENNRPSCMTTGTNVNSGCGHMMTFDSTLNQVPTLFSNKNDLSIRVPIEGSTIDFAAYENRALNSSPSSIGGGAAARTSSGLHESSF